MSYAMMLPGSKPMKAITDAVSLAADTSHLYARILRGEYSEKASSGYPEIRAARESCLTALNLNYSDGWEVIAFGGHMGSDMGKSNLTNVQNYLSWANGWSSELPDGTYRVLVCFGYCSEGGVNLHVWLGNTDMAHPYGTYWNCDDVTFSGSGALVIAFEEDLTYRNPTGVVAVVLHKR